jgi:hypothetical protein
MLRTFDDSTRRSNGRSSTALKSVGSQMAALERAKITFHFSSRAARSAGVIAFTDAEFVAAISSMTPPALRMALRD